MFPRCILSTPADHPERFHKAMEIGADSVMIDLEDGVGLKMKEEARTNVVKFFTSDYPKSPKFKYCLRINSIRNGEGQKDLLLLQTNNINPDYLILPKVEHPEEIQIIQEVLGLKRCPEIVASIESAKGLHNSDDIAQCKKVAAMIFGGGDLASDLGAKMEWGPLHYGRSKVVEAAATARIPAIDVPYLKLSKEDLPGLDDETLKVKDLGFRGKLAIHPMHVARIQELYYPSKEEIAYAEKVLSSFHKANEEVCIVDGQMIDYAMIANCQRIVDMVNTLK
ncbi:MAG: CoA ester lyase [Bacteroidales bacterium]